MVLDNALDAKQIRPLLPGTGKAHVIITSQRRLTGLDGVMSHSLDVFSTADAAALFTEIAGVDRTKSQPDAVAEIVALCGCLPLAVSIAASRFHNRPAWSLDHLLLRLRDERRRLAELSLDDRSVAAAFEGSYRSLQAEQRRLFCVLGFAADLGEEFDASTTAALMDISVPEADRLLEELLDAHMLRQRTAGRYYHHDLLREHARAKLAKERDIHDITGQVHLRTALSRGYQASGTIAALTARAAGRLDGFLDQLRQVIAASPVAGFDQAGLRVEGRLHWLQCARTGKYTLPDGPPRLLHDDGRPALSVYRRECGGSCG